MNNRDIEILKQNYERYRERLKNSIYKEDMDISSSCFVSFGTSFDEFMKKFRETEWE